MRLLFFCEINHCAVCWHKGWNSPHEFMNPFQAMSDSNWCSQVLPVSRSAFVSFVMYFLLILSFFPSLIRESQAFMKVYSHHPVALGGAIHSFVTSFTCLCQKEIEGNKLSKKLNSLILNTCLITASQKPFIKFPFKELWETQQKCLNSVSGTFLLFNTNCMK